MDWLRSEDLKEEKVLTTSKLTITRQGSIYLSQIDLETISAGPYAYACSCWIQAQRQKYCAFAGRGG
jgi:hypothetical protein